MTTGKTIASTRRTFVGKLMPMILVSETQAHMEWPRLWGSGHRYTCCGGGGANVKCVQSGFWARVWGMCATVWGGGDGVGAWNLWPWGVQWQLLSRQGAQRWLLLKEWGTKWWLLLQGGTARWILSSLVCWCQVSVSKYCSSRVKALGVSVLTRAAVLFWPLSPHVGRSCWGHLSWHWTTPDWEMGVIPGWCFRCFSTQSSLGFVLHWVAASSFIQSSSSAMPFHLLALLHVCVCLCVCVCEGQTLELPSVLTAWDHSSFLLFTFDFFPQCLL